MTDETGAVQAAKKHTAVAFVSLALLAALALVGSAGGVLPVKRDRVPPTAPANVRVTSATPTTISLAWDASTDNVGVAFYYVYVDAVRARVSGTTYTATNLECGQSVGVWIVAYDGALNKSPSAAATVSTAACEDMQAPTPPSGFRQAATSENAVVLAWDDSTDDVGVVGYGVYRNQLLLQSTSAPTADLTGLVCGSTYEYQADAFDAAGNRSALRSVWVETADCRPNPPPPSGWIFCADEWEQCTFTGTKEVRYGANATFTAPRVFSNAVSCTNSIFGDPLPGVTKRCEYRNLGGTPPPPDDPPADPPADGTPPSEPSGLAASGATATSVSLTWSSSTDNVGVVGYDVYKNGTRTGSVSSTSSIQGGLVCGSSNWFGVEALDAAGNRSSRARVNASTSACPPGPSGGWAFCANEWERCAFTGTKEVRYGANGTFTSPRVFSNGASCTNDLFGDPLPGVNKRCEYRDLGGAPPPPDDQPPPDQTPPSQPTNLGVASVTKTSVSLTWAAATDNVGVTGYGVYVNGGNVLTANQGSATVPSLACGTAFTFAVDAFDKAGNRSTKAQVTASTAACGTDTQAPTVPAGVSASSRTATSIALTWSASTDNVGVTGYGLYRGGTLAGTAATTTGIFSGLTCNTNYTLAVDAQDAAGNRSGKATLLVSTTACADTAPPSAPTGFAASNVTQSSLTLNWNASTDNVGVVAYDVYRNGTKMESTSSRSSSQTGLACATSYWFGVEALDAAGNRSTRVNVNAITTACAAPPPPPPSGSWSGPITITQGGTYTGSWESTSTAPAITVATVQPVTITGRVRNLVGGTLIDAEAAGAVQLTLDRVFAYGGGTYQTSGRLLEARNFKSITVRDSTIEHTRGIVLIWGQPNSSVLITKNKHRNIQGNEKNPTGNFVQFREVQNSSIEVSWNEIINEYDKSNPEDIVSLYKSSHARIHNNYFQHSSTPGNAYNTSSQGTVTVEYDDRLGPAPVDNEIWDNQFVDTVNAVYFGPGVRDSIAHHNRLIQDGKLPNGTQMGNGYSGWALHVGSVNCHMHDNVSGFVGRDGGRTDWHENLPGAPEGGAAEVAKNTTLPNPITQATEQAEWSLWQAKLSANGITIGA